MTILSVKACGMVTAVGFNAPASLAAIRAGIRNVKETNLWDAESGEFLAGGRVLIPHWWVGLGKLAELIAPAINECLVSAQPIPATEIPIMLGVAAPDRPFRWKGLDERILDEIQHRLRFKLHPESRVIPHGQISGVVGLQLAAELIERYNLQYCIVAGVDSLVRQDVVEYYLKKRRILTLTNSNGFSPGEAGSALLVTHTEESSKGELKILGVGIAKENATIESEDPLKGEGLTEAIGKAFDDSGTHIQDMHYRISDLNGEHDKFKEMVFAMMSYERKPKPKLFDLWHPIEYIGEVGAAIGPIVIASALNAGQKGYGIGPSALCTFGSDNGERAAVVTHFSAGNVE